MQKAVSPDAAKETSAPQIVLFSERPLFAFAFQRLIEENTTLTVRSLPFCAGYYPRLAPDFAGLLVVSVETNEESGAAIIRQLRQSLPMAKVLAVLSLPASRQTELTLQHEVDSICVEKASLDQLLEAVILTLQTNGKTMPTSGGAGSAGLPADPESDRLLTHREIQILELLHRGLSNRQIAEQLYVSVSTVKNHAGRIFSKLGAANRTQAVLRALALGLLSS